MFIAYRSHRSYEDQYKAQLEHATSAIEITRDNPVGYQTEYEAVNEFKRKVKV